MAQKGVVFKTSLSMKQCADVFREGADSARGITARMSEIGAKAIGNGEVTGFFTPTFDSPFASIDGVPDLAVGIIVLKFGGGAKGNGTPVHMYADERGDHRDVQIVSKHGLTGGMRSARLARKFLEQFQLADPNLQVAEGNL